MEKVSCFVTFLVSVGVANVVFFAVKSKAPVHVEEDDEEEELRRLQAEMAM
jgi:hypothetical protein